MQGLVFDIRRFSVHDGPGIRTTVFFKGCPLRCRWCHNPESWHGIPEEVDRVYRLEDREVHAKEALGRFVSAADVVAEVLKDRAFYEESGGGVTISGGEPLAQAAFLVEVLTLLQAEGIHTALDTSGFAQEEAVQQVAPLTDLFLFDIKHLSDSEHQSLTGVRNDMVLQNLRYLVGLGKKVVVRYPLIPGMNDGEENLAAMRNLFVELPGLGDLHILPYHSIANGKYRRFGVENPMEGTAEPANDWVSQVAASFRNIGVNVMIGG